MNEWHTEYTLNDLKEYAAQLAQEFGVPLENNEVVYPDSLAVGGSKFYQVDAFISFQVAQYHTRRRMVFHRAPGPQQPNHVSISFQEFTFADPHSEGDDCEEIFYNKGLGSVLCRSVQVKESMIVEPDTDVRVLFILLKEGWIDNVLKTDTHKEKFHRYFDSTRTNFRKEYLGPGQMRILKEIFTPTENRAISDMYYISRVMNLLEDFLTEVLQKDEGEENLLFARADDIRKMQHVTELIENNLNQPFQGVDYLSRWCCMSRTKFINLFQKVYGMSSYEYYQQKRLSIAYDSLKTGKHSIAAVAESIGYSSITNFNAAFKKEFGKLPKEVMQ
jgi:AraC-like DNA-binding protein